MIDANGEVLYVGKAKNIRKRIVAYTRPTGYDPRIERMIAATAALEFVSTATETEALLLEANLIKRLRPRFNVLLRDDKSFPYILITADHWAPQILKHRGARTRPGNYYGPFASVWAVNRTITALQRAFLLRSCSDGFFESRTRPCLLYQIKRCSGPCTREIDFAEYAELVREANAFLSGKSRAVKEELAAEMEKASADARFRARRDLSRPARRALGGAGAPGHQSAQRRGGRRLRRPPGGRLQSASRCSSSAPARTGATAPIFPRPTARSTPGEVLGAFLAQFYDDKPCPRCILLSHEIEERALLAEALAHQERAQGRDQRAAARREEGAGRARARQCARGARAQARRHVLATQAARRRWPRRSGCRASPRRIEVYDNSHIQGTNAVGAMIVAGPEGFRKNQYRKFNIRSADLTPGDDFGMMREVLTRRFKRLIDEAPRATANRRAANESDENGCGRDRSLRHPLPLWERVDRWSEAKASRVRGRCRGTRARNRPLTRPRCARAPSPTGERANGASRSRATESDESDEDDAQSPWPDLVLIDGGHGQLSAAHETLAALGLTDVPLVGIAKGPDRDAGRETFFLPGREPFKLKPRDPVLYFVQRLRDEAHRFAVGSHRARRRRDIREGGLQEIPGIGPTRKRALLQHFGTLKAIERASPADLAKVPGISAETARKIYDFFHERAG